MLRKIILTLGALALLAATGALLLRAQLSRLAAEQGLETIDWGGLHLHPTGISLDRLSLRRRGDDGSVLTLALHDLSTSAHGLSGWLPPAELHIARLSLGWQPPSSPQPDAEAVLPPLDAVDRWLDLAPLQARIDHWQMALPCSTGRCVLQGDLDWQRVPGRAQATLQLNSPDGAHRLALETTLSTRDAGLELTASVAADGARRLDSHHWLSEQDERLAWQGSLALGQLPEAAWVLDWLAQWTSFDANSLPAPPTTLRLGASWALTISRTDPSQQAGSARVSAHLPSPWPVPGWGLIEGDLDLAAQTNGGRWAPSELTTALQLQPEPALLKALPASLRPARLQLSLAPATAAQTPGRLVLAGSLTVDGPLSATLASDQLQVSLAPAGLAFGAAQLKASSSHLDAPQARLDDLHMHLAFTGSLDRSSASLQLLPGADLSLSGLRLTAVPDLTLRGLALTPDALNLRVTDQDGDWRWQSEGGATLAVTRLAHPRLRPQRWQWQGTWEADSTQPQAHGALSNAAGLSLATGLIRQPDGSLEVTAKMAELYLRAGNPLARTLSDWPESLTLAQGRLLLTGAMRQTRTAPLSAELNATARGLAGVYDRAEFEGLSASLQATLAQGRLLARLAPLSVSRINTGVPLGPLTFSGRYRASQARPGAGVIAWDAATLGLLGGELHLAAGEQPLEGPVPTQHVHLRGLELSELLAAYPTEGLHGDGTIDGDFALQLSPQGLVIPDGRLSARRPGVLRFTSARIEALGRANPAMRLVSQALHNFHYDVLRSDIRYDQAGKLHLGMRLEGRNPDLEGGRPIHFNINLEEDIPALLTSLQLSDRVSEAIQRRVQERLQRSHPGTAPDSGGLP